MRRFSQVVQRAAPWAWFLLFLASRFWSIQEAWAAGPAPWDPSGGCISLDEYWNMALATQDLLGGLVESAPDASSQALQNMADRWQAVRAVQLPGGEQLPVETSFVAAQLRAESPDIERLSALVDALLAARQAWPRGEFTSQDLAVLQEILSRPEFQWQEQQPSFLQVWWEKLMRFVQRLLDRLFGGLEGLPMLPLPRIMLIGLGLLAVLLVSLYAWRGMRASLASEAVLDTDGDGEEENLTADLALRKAQEMSAGGDYRLAVRYLYLSALLLLEERGLLRYDRSRTNREYLRSLAHLPELAANLREVVEVFDRVWYGYQPLDQAAFERYADYIARLRNNA
ncbi:MAG: DUF4129 domain-containing protein [Chloroflexota bacterium]